MTTATIITTGWQILGVIGAVLLFLGLACLALGLWAHNHIPHDMFDGD